MEQGLLVYDADCGSCSKFRKAVDLLDKYDNLRFISLVDAEDKGLLNSIPTWRRRKSFHLISPGDQISSGADAIPVLMDMLPLGRFASSLILKFPLGLHIVNLVYSTLSRLHDTGSCGYNHNHTISSFNQNNLVTAQKIAKGGNFRLPKHRFGPARKFHHLLFSLD